MKEQERSSEETVELDDVIVTSSELARLFGIPKDEPTRYLSIQSDFDALKKLNDSIYLAEVPVLAQFFASHLPALLDLLHAIPVSTELAGIALDILNQGLELRLPQVTTGLHRCPAARDLPRLVVQRFIKYPLTQLDKIDVAVQPDGSLTHEVFLPWTDLGVLLHLATLSVKFGPASHCNFHLEPSLLDALGTIGRHLLSTPLLEREDMEANLKPYFPGLNLEIMTAFALLGLPGGLERIPQTIRSQTEAMLRCGQGESGEEHHRCEALVGGGMCMSEQQELMLCSKCRCVAYCCQEHQKLDWKDHRPVCIKPSW